MSSNSRIILKHCSPSFRSCQEEWFCLWCEEPGQCGLASIKSTEVSWLAPMEMASLNFWNKGGGMMYAWSSCLTWLHCYILM